MFTVAATSEDELAVTPLFRFMRTDDVLPVSEVPCMPRFLRMLAAVVVSLTDDPVNGMVFVTFPVTVEADVDAPDRLRLRSGTALEVTCADALPVTFLCLRRVADAAVVLIDEPDSDVFPAISKLPDAPEVETDAPDRERLRLMVAPAVAMVFDDPVRSILVDVSTVACAVVDVVEAPDRLLRLFRLPDVVVCADALPVTLSRLRRVADSTTVALDTPVKFTPVEMSRLAAAVLDALEDPVSALRLRRVADAAVVALDAPVSSTMVDAGGSSTAAPVTL